MSSRKKDGTPYKVVRCHFYDESGRAIYPYCAEGSSCRFIHPYEKEWPGLPPRSGYSMNYSGPGKRCVSPVLRRRSPPYRPVSGDPCSLSRHRRSLSPLPKRPRYDDSTSMRDDPEHPYGPSGYRLRPDTRHKRVEIVKPNGSDLNSISLMEPLHTKDTHTKASKTIMHIDQQCSEDVYMNSACSQASFEPPQPIGGRLGVITLIGNLTKVHLRLLDDKKVLEDESLKLEAFESLAAKFDIREDYKTHDNPIRHDSPVAQISASSNTQVEGSLSGSIRGSGQLSHSIDGQNMAHMALIGTLDSIQQRKLKTEQRIKADYEEMSSILQEIWVDTFTSATESTQSALPTQHTSLLEQNANGMRTIGLSSGFSGSLAEKNSTPISSDELARESHKKAGKTSRNVSFCDEVGKNPNDKDAVRTLEEKFIGFEKKLSKLAAIEKENSKGSYVSGRLCRSYTHSYPIQLKAELKFQKDEINTLKKALVSQEQKLASIIGTLPNSKSCDYGLEY
ncbi:hypothetical protein FRB91_008974 [Serendipita sp. 411]|nr:hypothetical protein FRB91_008974 [Serendipita sp. 411]